MSAPDDNYDDHLREALLSTSQQFDRAILGLSTSALALSLAFIKDIVPSSPAEHLDVLFLSWGGFIGAIACTVISFQTSQAAIRARLGHDDKRGDKYGMYTRWFNRVAGGSFSVALVLTAVFVSCNLS